MVFTTGVEGGGERWRLEGRRSHRDGKSSERERGATYSVVGYACHETQNIGTHVHTAHRTSPARLLICIAHAKGACKSHLRAPPAFGSRNFMFS